MNQDKIKQALVEWYKESAKAAYAEIIPKDVEATWLAACEWLMSQASGTEFEQYEKWSRLYFGHGMPPSQSYLEATMSSFNFASLSCAKELSEKDEQFRKEEECWLISMQQRDERIAALESFLEMVIDPRKMPHQHADPQLRLYCLAERASELASKKEG